MFYGLTLYIKVVFKKCDVKGRCNAKYDVTVGLESWTTPNLAIIQTFELRKVGFHMRFQQKD